jgi:hypothetical protein
MADYCRGRAAKPGVRISLGAFGGVLVVVIKEAGLAGSLAAFGTGAVTYLGVRRLRYPRVSDT